MEFQKLNGFINNDGKSQNSKIESLIGKKIHRIEDLIKDVKESKNKDSKLYKITKDISKIIDLYDDNNKIKLNRALFLKNYYLSLESVFKKEVIEEYKEIMGLIVEDTVQYDNANWNLIYDNIKSSISKDNDIINKNALYSLDFERLIPKRLVSFLKDEKNEMIEGGFFSFQSYTQEMLGIINEFVLLKGSKVTKMYLEQGKKEDIKIIELLKEVSAASVVEPFSFSNGEPYFQKATNGQLDGFIIHKNQAKVLLATKDENTTIEGDSIFRHFITGLLIKKKIDEIEAKEVLVREKMQTWINHYTDEKRISKQIKSLKEDRRKFKVSKGMKLTANDFYVDNEFVKTLSQVIEDAEKRDLKEVSIPVKFPNSELYMMDREFVKKAFKLPSKNSKTNNIKMDLSLAKERLTLVSSVAAAQQEDREELLDLGFSKVVDNPKFEEQVVIDVKKAQIVKDAGFLSIRKMISYYNKNTRKALEELGVLESSLMLGTPLSILKQAEDNKYNIPSLTIDKMETLINIADNHNVDLIYYGSVSGKKQAQEYHYDSEEKITNKEYRYGLNALAYSNILSDSVKDRFSISTDAALEFVDNIKLRVVTKNTKNGYDIDLDKINENNFMKKIIHITFKEIFENNKINNDSVDFYENLFNSTNAILADIIEDFEYAKNYAEENNIELNYKEAFNKTMKSRTGEKNNYDIVKIFDTIKYISNNKTDKFIHGNSIIEAVNNKIDKIIENSNDSDLKAILDKYNTKNRNNKLERNRRVGRMF